jgi:hypothetical protein
MLISEAKTHVIDGVTYVEVDRKAEVGDKVLIVNAEFSYGMYRNGDLITVERMDDTGIYNKSIACVGTGGSNSSGCIYHEEYLVLEPLENESSPQITDLIANLANRVHSLEQQLRDTQRNLETWAEVTENMKYAQRLYNDKTSTTEFTVDMILHDLAGICEKIKKYGGVL